MKTSFALNVISPAEGNSDIVPPVENGESMEVEHSCGESPTFPTTPPIQTEASLLPEAIRMSLPDFLWAEMAGHDFSLNLEEAYLEITGWHRNLFLVPSGSVGRSFVKELTRLIDGYAKGSALESVALKAAMVMPSLVLQKPHAKSKTKDHVTHLDRCLDTWKKGDLETLLREGRAIQQRLRTNPRPDTDDKAAEVFARLMLEGKVHAALHYLSDHEMNDVLHLDDTLDSGESVLEALRAKHPRAQDLDNALLLQGPIEEVNTIIFDELDASAIRNAALHTHGAAGVSGLDATGWRRLCCSFKGASQDLCKAISSLARRLATTCVDPLGLHAFTACRLIPLNKNPRVRPIGIVETLQRISAKAILATALLSVGTGQSRTVVPPGLSWGLAPVSENTCPK